MPLISALRFKAPSHRATVAVLYRAVWRWHGLVGLVVVPLVLLLAVTGAIYAWRPQYEAWRYRSLLEVSVQAKTLTADEQFAAACLGQPWWATPVRFTPSLAAGRTSETVFQLDHRELLSVFVNPHDGKIVGTRQERERFMDRIRVLHGELFAGAQGQWVIELVASWVAVLLLTGLYLWWPRPRFRAFGFLLPRVRARGKVFWRDLHAVPAVWFSLGALWQIGTALPATRAAGAWLETIARASGDRAPKPLEHPPLRSELAGWTPPPKPASTQPVDTRAGASPIFGMSTLSAADRRLPPGVVTPPPITLERVVAIARERQVGTPYAIALANGPTEVVRVLSDRSVARGYTYLQLDQYTGRVLGDVNYGNFGAMNRLQRWTEVAHEGWLLGWPTQLLATAACAGVFLMAASGAVLWWRRRPAAEEERTGGGAMALPRPVLIGTLALALVLPLLAASLAVVCAFEVLRGWRGVGKTGAVLADGGRA